MENKPFEDVFEVQDVEGAERKFDRVTRIKASSENMATEVELDVNCEIYPVKVGEKITILLARSLALGSNYVDNQKLTWRDVASRQQETLADKFDYVMHGKVFKYDDSKGAKV
ncbi:DNA-directed RNA polymerases I, II, and III subunit RPABC3, partial [Nowakowskiella sp. JEL0078]